MNFIEHVREPQRLLLVWQGPEGSSRSRHTVAELRRLGGERVLFRYCTGTSELAAAQAEGFVNFPAFRKLDQSYELGVVETFMRRLPPRTRGDYAQYLEQFRLRPEQAISEFALLGYTGAKLPSDGFSIVDPLENVVGACDVLIEVAGFRYASQLKLEELRLDDAASFVTEPDNSHDSSALAVHIRNRKIGYVPRQQTAALREWLKHSAVDARVERMNGRVERPLVYLLLRARGVSAQVPPTARRVPR